MARRRTKRSKTSRLNEHVSGQLIIRFKPGAVENVARNPVAMSAKPQAVMAAMPDAVAGPIELLKEEVGLQAVRPLFVSDEAPAQPAAGTMALAAVHGALARSAKHPPRRSLRGFQLVEVKDKKVTPALLKRLRASKAVELVEPVPNRWLAAPSLIPRQWGLRAIRWFDVNHPDAETVHVGVFDSGIDDGHPNLKGAIEEYRHDSNTTRDFLGHGTHVGGIIAAVLKAAGIAGVANCQLHCWKIFDDPKGAINQQNFNFEFYSAALASALDSDIKVINLSIGGTAHSETEATVFAELRDAGVVVVAAMGNEYESGNPKEYPAGYPGVLAVGAVDRQHQRASFSCTGDHIGLAAPGVDILSTVPRVKAAFAKKTNYDSWPGTSMATPHVAGAAALLYAKRAKSKTAAAAIVRLLTSTAMKLPGMKKKAFTQEYGFGLLDLAAALAKA